MISLPMLTSLFWLIYFLSSEIGACIDLPDNPHDSILRAVILFFLSTTLLYGCHFLYYAGFVNPIGETVYAATNLLVYPLFYIFLVHLTNNELTGDSNTQNLYVLSTLFLPAAIILIAYTICFFTKSEQVRDVFTIFARICFAAQVVFVWIAGSRMLRRYRHELDDFYSDNRSYRLRPLHILLQIFAIISILSSTLNIIGREWFISKTAIAVPAILMSVLLYALGYTISRLYYIVPVPINTIEPQRTDTGEPFKSDKSTLKVRLEQLMQDEKPYLRANLTVQNLAAMLATNRTYLSEVFREELNTSFSSYINTLRIEHAKLILADPQFETHKEAIITAQVDSGFASDSTFYHLFKQHTGLSPLVYRQQQLKK